MEKKLRAVKYNVLIIGLIQILPDQEDDTANNLKAHPTP
jgi:hypothetical protein